MRFLKINIILVSFHQAILQIWATPIDLKNYESKRREILQFENGMAFGGSLVLEGDEKLANECLMTAKFKELNEGK